MWIGPRSIVEYIEKKNIAPQTFSKIKTNTLIRLAETWMFDKVCIVRVKHLKLFDFFKNLLDFRVFSFKKKLASWCSESANTRNAQMCRATTRKHFGMFLSRKLSLPLFYPVPHDFCLVSSKNIRQLFSNC